MNKNTFTFYCGESPLIGIIDDPENTSSIGVLMVAGGGPQYRVGGHRQLLLWARRLCEEGYPVMRFDYRGMGDSGGRFSSFEQIEADLNSAIRAFVERCPKIERLILWGECDASSAILIYAYKDPRIIGMSLQNPWVRTVRSEAKTYLKHYYVDRFFQRSFWQKILHLEFNPVEALRSILQLISKAGAAPDSEKDDTTVSEQCKPQATPYPARMKEGLRQFRGKLLLIMSGRDLIAREFDEVTKADKEWASLMRAPSVHRVDIAAGDHTFSSQELRDEVIGHGISWVKSLEENRA